MSLRIWHFSDSHTFHEQLTIPENIDIAIFSGDEANPRDPLRNEIESRNFLSWYSKVPIKYKIFIAGNHSTAIESGYVDEEVFKNCGVIYLENQSIEVEGLKIWGSPYTPKFGLGWSYNMDRSKLHNLWATIPDDTDIVVVHGPPKGILDLSYDRNDNLEFCGCEALRKRMQQIKPKFCMFGHIHSMTGVANAGYLIQADHDTIYSNGTVVFDGRFDKGAVTNGNVFEI